MARRRRHSRGGRFLFCLLILVMFLIGYNRIFRVQEIIADGVSPDNQAYVISLSGVQMDMSIFDVNQHDVQAAISADSYLAFEGLTIQYPDTVLLHVRERMPAGAVATGGVYILIDEEGHILEYSKILPSGMPFVTGVKIASATRGTKLTSYQSDQIPELLAIIQALKARNMLDRISYIDVNDRNNLYLVTQDDIKAILGDQTKLTDKILWLQVSLEEMARLGYTGGQLDLSSGKNAVFAPAAP